MSVSCRLARPSLRGVRTIARGRVAEIREGAEDTIVDLEVWTETEDGTVLAPGTATVALGPD